MFEQEKLQKMQDTRKEQLKQAYLDAGGSAFVFSIATYEEIEKYLADKAERDTALPASVDSADSIEDWLG